MTASPISTTTSCITDPQANETTWTHTLVVQFNHGLARFGRAQPNDVGPRGLRDYCAARYFVRRDPRRESRRDILLHSGWGAAHDGADEAVQ